MKDDHNVLKLPYTLDFVMLPSECTKWQVFAPLNGLPPNLYINASTPPLSFVTKHLEEM